MAIRPKKFKNYKMNKFRLHGYNCCTKSLTKGIYGLRALDYARLSAKDIETLYMAVNKILQKQGTIYINIFPNVSVTSKAIASRMGKGKGAIKTWVALIKPGKIILELNCINDNIANTALHYGATKLPIKTKIIRLKKYK